MESLIELCQASGGPRPRRPRLPCLRRDAGTRAGDRTSPGTRAAHESVDRALFGPTGTMVPRRRSSSPANKPSPAVARRVAVSGQAQLAPVTGEVVSGTELVDELRAADAVT